MLGSNEAGEPEGADREASKPQEPDDDQGGTSTAPFPTQRHAAAVKQREDERTALGVTEQGKVEKRPAEKAPVHKAHSKKSKRQTEEPLYSDESMSDVNSEDDSDSCSSEEEEEEDESDSGDEHTDDDDDDTGSDSDEKSAA